MDFKTLDIEIADECALYAGRYDKIFSFYRLLWVRNKLDALVNMHTMLKSRGEILIQFLLDNPIVELYKFMDAEWQTYVQVGIFYYKIAVRVIVSKYQIGFSYYTGCF